MDYVENNSKDVEIMNSLDNSDYDDLLSQNIVFLDLKDASAVNTVLECIIRNTPILVNKLPSIVELLGKNYPFFFNDLSHASDLLTSAKINETTKYLSRLDKDKLSIKTFQETFKKDVLNIYSKKVQIDDY